jgi:predicted ATP-dependent protease
MARMIAGLVRREALLPFGREAVARTIDWASRLAGDARKLSAEVGALARLLHEADHLARAAQRATVSAADIDAAIDGQRARADRLKRRLQEAILRGTVLIDTDGAKIGQVNGLSVIELGEFPFAAPTRITATTRIGEGQVIDIQREAALGGAIHSKGVMILSQFLAARFSANHPHSLAASLAFEQTYSRVDGDSASLAELCALLSSLAGLPIRQSLAVTGSVNQLGEVQAIGAVNEKIEGFFDICAARGLTGAEGVIIPAANIEHLMLDEPVVAAVASGKFGVYAVRHVDEAIELLTGTPAGDPELGAAGLPHTVNARVAARLAAFAAERRERGPPAAPGGRGPRKRGWRGRG